MDVDSWLPSSGLERYEAAFSENEIDETCSAVDNGPGGEI
jgi:hypothetical protein